MVEAIPLDPVFPDFEFRDGERVVAQMKSSRWRARAEVVISAENDQLHHEGFFRRDFVVAQDRRVLERAARTSGAQDDFSLMAPPGAPSRSYPPAEPCRR